MCTTSSNVKTFDNVKVKISFAETRQTSGEHKNTDKYKQNAGKLKHFYMPTAQKHCKLQYFYTCTPTALDREASGHLQLEPRCPSPPPPKPKDVNSKMRLHISGSGQASYEPNFSLPDSEGLHHPQHFSDQNTLPPPR